MAAGLKVALGKRFPNLDLDVALELPAGSITALLGPSGAGKTTLLRCLAGLTRPDRGEIRFGAEVWDGPPQQRGVGMVFRPPALFPNMTARENVAFGARDAAWVTRLLQSFELEAFAGRHPRQLSSGEQQRVAIARALAPRPRLLLLDEPFTALDGPLERRLHGVFRAIAAELGAPVLFATHDLAEAGWLADRLAVMAGGRLLQTGGPAEVLQRPQTAAVAQLVGVSNLLEGRGEGDGLTWGGHLLLPPRAVAGPVTWGIRPERIELAALPSGRPNELTGRILHVAPWGHHLRLAIEVPGSGQLDVLVPFERGEALGLAAGRSVTACLPPAHLLLFER